MDLPRLTTKQLDAVADLDGFRAALAEGDLPDRGVLDYRVAVYPRTPVIEAMLRVGIVPAINAILAAKTPSSLLPHVTGVIDVGTLHDVEHLVSSLTDLGVSPNEYRHSALHRATVCSTEKLGRVRAWIDRFNPVQATVVSGLGSQNEDGPFLEFREKCVRALDQIALHVTELEEVKRGVEEMRACIASIAIAQGGGLTANVDLPMAGNFRALVDALACHPQRLAATAQAPQSGL